jgi:DNA polymerase I-like protein with 3'-5' exonuclease and polymerase domains
MSFPDKAYAYDGETTIRNRGEGAVGSRQASPFFPGNFLVSWGESRSDAAAAIGRDYIDEYRSSEDRHMLPPSWLQLAAMGQSVTVAAHNATFDLLYVMKTWPDVWKKALPTLRIWCTMQAAYMLSGQTLQMPSLDLLAEQQGLPLKDSRIADYWAQGIDTPLIPKDELLEYQKQDVLNTLELFEAQWEEAEARGMLPLMLYKMDDILASAIQTWNGMMFSLAKADELAQQVEAELQVAEAAIIEVAARGHFADDFEFMPSSAAHLSALLFGGEYKVVRDVEVRDEAGELVRYKGGAKAGQVKTRKETVVLKTKGLGLKPPAGVKATIHGYSTADNVLELLDPPVVEQLRAWRGLSKDLETYYRGYAALVFPDGCLHPNYNNEIAATGRQSCSAPNLQNTAKDPDA